MKLSPNASAIKRASVVLPTPGGPHRIIECGRPDSNATRSGLPGPSKCGCPTTSSIVRGRMRSASGTPVAVVVNRSCIDWANVIDRLASAPAIEYDQEETMINKLVAILLTTSMGAAMAQDDVISKAAAEKGAVKTPFGHGVPRSDRR